MILSCPSCASRFEVDPAHLGRGGRKVRCGQCSHVWHQAAEPPAGSGDEPDRIPAPISKLQEFDEVRRRSTEPESDESGDPARRRTLLLPWLLFALVLVVIGLGLFFGKDKIIQAIPEAARLYQMAGFDVDMVLPGAGLEMRDIKQVRSLEDDRYTLLIQGTIANISQDPRPVPGIRVTITDEAEQVVDSWTFEAEVTTLDPGQSTTFQTSITDPPRNGDLALSFEAGQP